MKRLLLLFVLVLSVGGCQSFLTSPLMDIQYKKKATLQGAVDSVEDLLIRHEGYSRKPYNDNKNTQSIGYGRNLTTNGITREEALYLLRNDIERVRTRLQEKYSYFSSLDKVRQDVLISMGYTMGVYGLSGFKNMWEAVESQDWAKASFEIYTSEFCLQTKSRCGELAMMMASGKPYTEN